MIIEPITAFENRQAAPTFYKKLRAMTKELGVPLIVDETRTGLGSTGKMWGHEHWYLNEDRDGGAPDLVTFGGRTGISGFYASRDFKVKSCFFETSVNMVDVLAFGATWKAINDNNLLKMVDCTGSFLKIELGNLARDKGFIRNVRGNGTYLGFDVDENKTDNVQKWLLKRGILVGRSGDNTLCVRPPLVMLPLEAAHLRNELEHYHPNHDLKRPMWG